MNSNRDLEQITMSSRYRMCRSARNPRARRLVSAQPASRCTVVESNFRVQTPTIPEVRIERSPYLPEVHFGRKSTSRESKPREITINDSPMMLLPKARVRESMEYYDSFHRSYNGVIADTSTQGLHISTIQSVVGMESRTPTKPAIKSRKNSISQSEADSGFCSLKRSVTFEDISRSQSTVFRSDDELDNMSDTSSDERHTESYSPSPEIADSDDFPTHLESFGNDAPVVFIPPRPPSRQCHSARTIRRGRHVDQDGHDSESCEICGVVLTDKDRVQKSFGKVDTFLDWVMTKWGKVRSSSSLLFCLSL